VHLNGIIDRALDKSINGSPKLPDMDSITQYDRIKGSILGTLIGDALGLGPHWIYDLDELKTRYGPWIDNYTAPTPNPRFPAVWQTSRRG
jgi:hypothetical protein